MEIWYHAIDRHITPVRVVKVLGKFIDVESETTIVDEIDARLVVTKSHKGTRVDRVAKSGRGSSYFPTWQQAHEHLLNGAQEDVQTLRLRLERANSRLGNIKGLKPPVA